MIKLDRLLDTKYTQEELKTMISQFKVGQEVRLTNDCLLWIKNNAYYMHTIGAKQEDGIITKKNAEESFFIDLFISNNYPYQAVITEILSDVGDRFPGARLKVTLPHGLSKIMIQSVIDFY